MSDIRQRNTEKSDYITEIAEEIYRVKILNSSVTAYCVCPKDFTVQEGDYVVVPTRYGNDLGSVLGKTCDCRDDVGDIVEIYRKVNQSELAQYKKNKEKSNKAFTICREKIAEYGLEMKLVSANYLFGEPKILFFFTAETRVDFRELVKKLVSIFRMRIELRQIGVRDESRVIGGMGVCGRDYCCHSLTDKLNPVSIKMAKKQNLSLNSLKISGPCGRLLCCLSYEYSYYKKAKDNLPSEGTKLSFEGETCKILEVNIFSKYIKLSSEKGRMIEIPFNRLLYCKAEKRWKIN